MGEKELTIERYFSEEKDVYNQFGWEKTDVDITDDMGKKLFTQKDVEFPKNWSPLARKIVASKYFYGDQRKDERETSMKQLLGRVSETFYDWAIEKNYFSQENAKIFRDELSFLSLEQMMSFNSPVWFNVGLHKRLPNENRDSIPYESSEKEAYVIDNGEIKRLPAQRELEYPQTSACFIQSVEDTMEGIMDLAKNEALLFKYGSGTGTNLSTLRSSRERLSSGGKPSGPLAYWNFYDKVAGIVKSGGKTRRAAKMDILDISHPDIEDFIESKKEAQKIIQILESSGIDPKIAREIAPYQNTNISVRVSDKFMQAVEDDEEWQTTPVHSMELASEMPKYKAKDLLRKIAEGTHFCGDPGMQYEDTINTWHTCKNSGKIRSSNPCSEFMFLDDSSCNLASLNLMSFLSEDNGFDIEKFSRAIKLTAIAQDLEVDGSSFPTKKIAENSHKFRPLGMGYANLGSLLMYLGLPYDSDEARTTASAITSLLTAKVYETSTEMAEKIGTFKEFEKNKEPMMKIMEKHLDATKKINRMKIPRQLENIVDEAEKTWEKVIERGEKYGFRNSQATVLAPTGTIGFMMDCDTKGIEPEIGLIQTKLLSDGGQLRLVNSSVEKTLKRLEYNGEQIKNILGYINKNETIEGCEELKQEHLPIFDCSNKPPKGKRTISPKGHLKMMAAVQPFISGAISKTVNLPKEATVEEIEQVYIDAWKLGLKSVALYRDESKSMQPLSFTKKEEHKPVRRKLPTTRNSLTHKFDIVGHEGYMTVGMYEEGNPGEVFIGMNKEGSTIKGLMDTIGILTSMSLQYGVPIEDLIKKFRHQRFEPSGLVYEGHPEIKTADSITDYIFHFMEKTFLTKEEQTNGEPKNTNTLEIKLNKEKNTNNYSGELGGLCPICGKQMHKKGDCNESCDSCAYEDTKGCGG